MALNLAGSGGELRRGTQKVADLATWHKQERRVTFTTGYVNQFAAGLGPPTEIILPVSRTVRRIYPISGDWTTGAVHLDLVNARTETTL
jgi:hypothetical protein